MTKMFKRGDIVLKYTPTPVRVSKVTEDIIECGPFYFDAKTFREIPVDLGWGLIGGHSYLSAPPSDYKVKVDIDDEEDKEE